MQPNFKKHILSGFLLVGVLGMAVYHRHEVVKTLRGIEAVWAIAGFFCLLVNYCLRAVRFHVLTNSRLKVWPQGIYCVFMHGFATYMLPLRSGDLSLPFLLKSTIGLGLQEGAAVLLKARLLEVFALGLWFVVAATFPYSKLSKEVVLPMAACGVVMVASPFILKRLLGLSVIPFEKVRTLAKRFAQTGSMTLVEVTLTCCIWISIALGLWCVTFAIQLQLPLMDLFLLIALQLAMQLIPLQGFGNSGNHEGSWIAALALLGIPGDAALKFALTSHAVILVYVLIVGVMALIIRNLIFRIGTLAE